MYGFIILIFKLYAEYILFSILYKTIKRLEKLKIYNL